MMRETEEELMCPYVSYVVQIEKAERKKEESSKLEADRQKKLNMFTKYMDMNK